MSSKSSALFQPLKVGRSLLQHRVAMAPLTRFRADDEHVPQIPLVQDYYEQRGSVPGTLLVTEATFISPEAGGYPNAPGIWNDAQIEAWRKVTSAVHAKGSFIYSQLWALGRTANPQQLASKGFDLISSGDVPMDEKSQAPRPLTSDEIQQYIATYAQAAKNAIAAGFDGVEVHGANGYLPDQFLQDMTNNRTDAYGGSIENRARFVLDIVRAVVAAVGDSRRVGIRLSPYNAFQGMGMADPIPQFEYTVQQLQKLDIGYVHFARGVHVVTPVHVAGEARLVSAFLTGNQQTDEGRAVLLAGGYEVDSALKEVDEVYKDKNVAVVFGRHFIANPDLPFRLRQNIALNPYDRSSFYTPKISHGYDDYPFSPEFLASVKSASAAA